MKRILALLAIAWLTMGAAWTDTWTGSGIDASAPSVGAGQRAYIVLPNAANADSISPVLGVSHLASVCMDTNFATLPGTSEGTGTVEVLTPAAEGNTDGTDAVLLGTLSAGSPCVHAGPGPIMVRVKAAPNTAGGIVVIGY